VTVAGCIYPVGHFPGIGAVPAVAGAALIILAVHSGETNAFLRSRSMAAAHPNVEIIDLTDYFCTAIICPPVKGGVALYWDTHHVSSTAARGFVLPTRHVAGQP